MYDTRITVFEAALPEQQQTWQRIHIGSVSEREFREATFFGGEYLVYDLTENRNGFMSREERLTFRFRTRHLNGMLFYCGDQTVSSVISFLNRFRFCIWEVLGLSSRSPERRSRRGNV